MAKLSPATQETIRGLKDHYPHRRSAVMPALQAAQKELGHLEDDVLGEIAELLEVPANWTAEVVSFYTMFDREKKGKYKIEVCHNLGCSLMGAEKVIKQIEESLGIECGRTTPDGKFTLQRAECLGACGWAPMFMIGDTYYEFLTREKVDAILEALKKDETPPGGPAGKEVLTP